MDRKFMWNFKRFSPNIAICEKGKRHYTYRELNEFREELSEYIPERSLILLIASNTLGSLVGYVTCIVGNIVPILISESKTSTAVTELSKEYSPNYVWCPIRDVGQHGEYEQIFQKWSYCLLRRKVIKAHQLHEKLALLLPTSGTTGASKLVRMSRDNLDANANAICSYMKLNSNDRAITSLPMSYTYGLSVINTILKVGASLYITELKIVQQEFWELAKECEITFFAGVPFHYEMMKKLRIAERELPALRLLTQAGGKLSDELQLYWAQYAQNKGKDFFVMYGQTEATARISYLSTEKSTQKIGSVGVAIPGTKLYVENGEVVCEGAHVTMGYAQTLPDLALGDENQGVLYTGDLGYMDDDGYLYLTGRKNRFAKIFGHRYDLSYMEAKAKDFLGRYTVILSDDKKIYLYTESKLSEEDMAQLAKFLTVNPLLLESKKIDSIPRLDSGKIKYDWRTWDER